MAVSADRVIVELEARIGKYRRDMEAAEKASTKSLGKIGSDAKKAERQILQSSTAISGSLRNLAGSYSRLLAVAGIGILAKKFIELADANKQLEATLRLATATFGSFNQAQRDTERIATETRAGLNETAKLYASFTRVAAEAGITQEQAARATETFAKSLKIGGATAQEASSATLQFNQALASGVLRGEEFNAVNEASARTTKLLAESLGVPQGALRKLAEEGKLTRDVLINALVNTKYTKGIDEEFKVLPITVGDSLTLVKNAAQQTFGAFDRGGEFSTALANFFKGGAKGFGDLSGDAEQFGREVRAVLDGLGDAFQPFIDAGKAALSILGADSASIGEQIRQDIRNIASAYDALNAFGANTIGTARTNAVGDFDRRVAASQRKAAIVKGGDGLRALINAQNARNGVGARPAAAAAGGGGRARARASGGRGKSAEQLANEELRNEQEFLDALRRLRAEQLQNELGVTTDGEKRLAIQGELAGLERESRIAAINADKSLTEARRKRLLEETNKAFGLEADGETVNTAFNTAAQARARELEERNLELAQISLRDKIDTLQTDADLATNRVERLAIQRRILELEQQEERDNLELAIKRGEIIDAEDARLRLKQRQGNASERVERDNESPLQRFRREVGEVGNNINDELEKVQVDGLNALNDGLVDAITGAKSLGDVFNDIANSIIKDLLRIAIQQAIIGPLVGSGGGGGGFFGALLGAIPGVAGAAFGGGGASGGSFFKDLGFSRPGYQTPGFGDGINGKRASGGNVVGGGRYLVGENGPEIAEFGKSGKIYPTGSLKAQMSGGGTIVIAPQQFDLSGVVMTEDLIKALDSRNRAYADQVGRTATSQAIRGAGAYNDRQRKLKG